MNVSNLYISSNSKATFYELIDGWMTDVLIEFNGTTRNKDTGMILVGLNKASNRVVAGTLCFKLSFSLINRQISFEYTQI